MNDPNPPPTARASAYLVVEVVTKPDRGAGRAARLAWAVLKGIVLREGSLLLRDHRVGLEVRSWGSGEVVYEQDREQDPDGAAVGKQMIQSDLDRMSIGEFLSEYGVDRHV